MVTQVAAARSVWKPSVPALRRAKRPRLKLNFYPVEFQLLLSTQTWIIREHGSWMVWNRTTQVTQACVFSLQLSRYISMQPHVVEKGFDTIACHLQIPTQVRRVHNSSAWAGLTTVLI